LGIAALLSLTRWNSYTLNRAVREIAFRMVQLETLSRTTRTDYRIRFETEIYTLSTWEKESETWQPYLSEGYYKGMECTTVDYDIVFSEGRFDEMRYRAGQKKPPRYLIVELQSPKSRKTRGIIFYRDKDWRVLN
jgi:hypothetical protein